MPDKRQTPAERPPKKRMSRGTRVLVQAQGQRFQSVGWAKKTGAKEMTTPGEFHKLMGAQRYQGL